LIEFRQSRANLRERLSQGHQLAIQLSQPPQPRGFACRLANVLRAGFVHRRASAQFAIVPRDPPHWTGAFAKPIR